MSNRGLHMTEEQLAAILKKRERGVIGSTGECGSPGAGSKPAAHPKSASYLEEMLAQHIQWAGLPAPQREFRFAPPRRWRIDFAWGAPGYMQDHSHDFPVVFVRPLAVEVQGEVHRIKGRFDADIPKIQALTLAGWRYLPISSKDIRTGKAIELIEKALKL